MTRNRCCLIVVLSVVCVTKGREKMYGTVCRVPGMRYAKLILRARSCAGSTSVVFFYKIHWPLCTRSQKKISKENTRILQGRWYYMYYRQIPNDFETHILEWLTITPLVKSHRNLWVNKNTHVFQMEKGQNLVPGTRLCKSCEWNLMCKAHFH